jgi:hypothetical protein
MSTSNTNIINPKACTYGCNTRIYWDNSSSSYLEVFTKKKHICPNRSKSNNITQTTTNTTNKPTYYKKSYYATQPKPKMDNSIIVLQGSVSEVTRKYEILSDIVTEYNGKINCLNLLLLIQNLYHYLYIMTPEGKRD